MISTTLLRSLTISAAAVTLGLPLGMMGAAANV